MSDKVWERPRSHGAAPSEAGTLPVREMPAPAAQTGVASGLPTAGIFKELSRALSSMGATVTGFLELVALEARGAGVALVWMVAGSFLAVVFFAGAWLALLVAAALWAMSLGLSPIAVAIAVAVINLLGGAALIYGCIALSRALLFSATRRQLAAQFSAKPQLP